jgi:hypothetical protein
MVTVNSTTVAIIGGREGGEYYGNKTFFYNINIKEWTRF